VLGVSGRGNGDADMEDVLATVDGLRPAVVGGR